MSSIRASNRDLVALLAWRAAFGGYPPERKRRVTTDKKYGPCPCGSGKKFKWCCGSANAEERGEG